MRNLQRGLVRQLSKIFFIFEIDWCRAYEELNAHRVVSRRVPWTDLIPACFKSKILKVITFQLFIVKLHSIIQHFAIPKDMHWKSQKMWDWSRRSLANLFVYLLLNLIIAIESMVQIMRAWSIFTYLIQSKVYTKSSETCLNLKTVSLCFNK